MELLQQNWAWIASNPWGFMTLAVVVFGLGWGAAKLYYRERIELLKIRAGDAEREVKNKGKSGRFEYKPSGRHGQNILAPTTHDVKVGQSLSLQSNIPDGQRLHVVLHGSRPESLGQKSAAWYFNVVGVTNWIASLYQEGTSSPVQHFNAEVGPADMKFSFSRVGDIRIEVFEGGSTSHSWSKGIRVLA